MDIKLLLEELKESPYEELAIKAPHCGTVRFAVTETGKQVLGPSGTWKEKPGTLLLHLERENNKKPINAQLKGEIKEIKGELEGQFVQAGTHLLTIRHFLTREEVLQVLLQKALHLFTAPEKAKYYFVPEVDQKIKSKGCQSVRVTRDMELFILSRMKRETSLPYSGPEGIIYTVYFQANENVDMGEPLIGVCPVDRLDMIQEVVSSVQSEWKEGE
jgi:biotin carboxyl carrier protein